MRDIFCKLLRTTKTSLDILVHGLLFLTLILIFITNIYFWPIPRLGIYTSPWTHEVTEIDPLGSADLAGIQVGDRIISAYGDVLWVDLLNSSNVLALTPPLSEPIPFTFERDNQRHTVLVWQQEPHLSFQLEKGIRFSLAFLCWLTGYTILVIRRHHATGSRLASLFWICLGYIFGVMLFSSYASFKLNVALYWILTGFVLPLCPFLFIQFIPRISVKKYEYKIQRFLLIIWTVMNGIIVFMIREFFLFDILNILNGITIYLWIIVFIFTGFIVWYQYKREIINHVKRQLRIVSFSCILVGIIWIICASIKNIIGYNWEVINYITPIAPIIIPISFLIIYIATDLYHIDRIIRKSTVTLLTIAILTILTQWIKQFIPQQGILLALVAALYSIVLYRPIYTLVQWLIPVIRIGFKESQEIEKAIHSLTTSLDPSYLIQTIITSINQTFGTPSLAFYHAEPSNTAILRLSHTQRLDLLPLQLQESPLQRSLQAHQGRVIEGQKLFHTIKDTGMSLTVEEEGMLNHPRIMLWCPILNPEQRLLGILALGMRGDLDPYRQQDLQLLERLLDASSLALANSAAYMMQKESKDLIRQLFHALKQSQDETAAAIARELHDEVININLRLNIQSLEQVIKNIQDASLREELQLVLDTEHDTTAALRSICERLQPTAIHDPYGLPAILRMQIQRIQPLWSGVCNVSISGDPIPLPASFQHEILRITREALMNVVKHANATEIMIDFIYPHEDSTSMELVITDNGGGNRVISPIQGHFGLHNMRESARAINGSICFETPPYGGTQVILIAPKPHAIPAHSSLEEVAR